MQIERTDIKFTCVFYDVCFLSVAIHQNQLSNYLFSRIWRNVYL